MYFRAGRSVVRMTEVRQRAMRIISVMPEADVERFVNLNIRLSYYK